MECYEKFDILKNASTFTLITKLCDKIYLQNKDNCVLKYDKSILKRMRQMAYEVLLNKSTFSIREGTSEPVCDLLSYYFIRNNNRTNIIGYKNMKQLKELVDWIFTENMHRDECFLNILKCIIGLKDTAQSHDEQHIHKNPFTFGVIDEMLPKPKVEEFGSPMPYQYYPSHLFELPFAISNFTAKQNSCSLIQWKPDAYVTDAPSYVETDPKQSTSFFSFLSMSQDSQNKCIEFPRLSYPRDLAIPREDKPPTEDIFFIREIYPVKSIISNTESYTTVMWQCVNEVDDAVSSELWGIAAKMPPKHQRSLIAMSPAQIRLWKEVYEHKLNDLSVVSEKKFISHIMYLTIGINSSSFTFDEEKKIFVVQPGLVLEGISTLALQAYLKSLLIIGTLYRRLYDFAMISSYCMDVKRHSGYIFEAARDDLKMFLLAFRLQATSIYEDCCMENDKDSYLPTLLQIVKHMRPLQKNIETMARLYKVSDADVDVIPRGAGLMAYLYREISLVTHPKITSVLYKSLQSICKVYFKFIERFLFEGELEDNHNEFFIKKDDKFINSLSRRYWDCGFYITDMEVIPQFLQLLAKDILLCGKSLRLLKECNPNDPLCILISNAHPTIKCCMNFEEIDEQQKLLDLYRTKCLFACGEPITLDVILVGKEAERKAFSEMVSLKQAETYEKAIAERKRLSHLILAEKQHSLRVLEMAMAEAKLDKERQKFRQRRVQPLEVTINRTEDNTKKVFRNAEKEKILEYYNQLGQEVEKRKIHSEWKMKRLQLDESRVQLLSSEERNMKREKLELDCANEETAAQRLNEEMVAENAITEEPVESYNLLESYEMLISHPEDLVIHFASNESNVLYETEENNQPSRAIDYTLDNELNHLHQSTDLNKNVIAIDSNDVTDDVKNLFQERKIQALRNKQKVMKHEFGYECELPDNSRVNQGSYESRKNKEKVLGSSAFDNTSHINNNAPLDNFKPANMTDAQEQALRNKQKVLGSEYRIDANFNSESVEDNHQNKTLKNNIKCLVSNHQNALKDMAKFDRASPKRSNLILDLSSIPLKGFQQQVDRDLINVDLPSLSCLQTPIDIFNQVDLETPTTADIRLMLPQSAEGFSPNGQTLNLEDCLKPSTKFLTSDGFIFPTAILEESIHEIDMHEIQESTLTDANMSSLSSNSCEAKYLKNAFGNFKTSVWNFCDDTLNFDNFDPFGVRGTNINDEQPFTSKLHAMDHCSPYGSVLSILKECQNKPNCDIFFKHSQRNEQDEVDTAAMDIDITTIAVCLQRSVMLPLSYQLEVVNNSILTHFLVDLDLYGHLKSLKNYFFLMDGEFSKTICHHLFDKLTTTCNAEELLNFATLHNILNKAFISSITSTAKFSDNLSFTVTDAPLSFQHSSPDVLQCLSLTYSIEWPLNVILSAEALERYGKVFQFILKMRRISWILGRDFELLKVCVKYNNLQSDELQRSTQYRSVQIYRHTMASFVRSVDNYIVTTCIQTCWNDFENNLKKARTLDDMYNSHVAYIKKLLSRCLLSSRSTCMRVMKILNNIFILILRFDSVLRARSWHFDDSIGQLIFPYFSQLKDMFILFEKMTRYLHKTIIKVMDCGLQPHFIELLTMTNLNGYYDTTVEDCTLNNDSEDKID